MNTKTKKRLGIVSIVLVLLLASGATIGTTLAKYISSATVPSQTATVAKWGFVLNAGTESLFWTDYDTTGAIKTTDGNGVISSSSTDKIVAPCAKGSATLLTIDGTAEVNAKLQISVTEFATILLSDGENDNYYPIVWKLNGTPIGTDGKNITADDIATSIKTVLTPAFGANNISVSGGVVTVNIPAKTTLTSSVSLTFSWEWAFGSEGFTVSGNDAKDTILGQLKAGTASTADKAKYEEDSVLTTTITIQAVVAQTMDDFTPSQP